MQLALTQTPGAIPTLAGFVRELASLVDDDDAAPARAGSRRRKTRCAC